MSQDKKDQLPRELMAKAASNKTLDRSHPMRLI